VIVQNVIRNQSCISKEVNVTEWGNYNAKKGTFVLPPFYFYFKKKKRNLSKSKVWRRNMLSF